MIVDLKSKTKDTYGFVSTSDQLKRYYADIRRYHVMSREEELAAFNKMWELKECRKCDHTIKELVTIDAEIDREKNKIINSNQRLVVSVAKKFTNGKNLMDLIEEGNIGLIMAVNSFDPNNGAKFSTFAVWYIRRQINRYCIETMPAVRKTNAHKTFFIKSRAINKFQQKEQRDPSPSELMDFMNENYSYEIKDESDITDMRISSLDFKVDDEDKPVNSMLEMACSSKNLFEDVIDFDEIKRLTDVMLDKLSKRDKYILKKSFGIDCDKEYGFKEISEQLEKEFDIKITPERVRQIRNKGVEKIQELYVKLKR